MNKCNPLQTEQWFIDLTEELRDLVVEGEFTSRWTLIQVRHTLGSHLLENLDKFPKDIDPIKAVAKAIKKSSRLVYQTIQFAKKFPDINSLPDGKIITWAKIANELLADKKKPKPDLKDRIKLFITDYFPAIRKSQKELLMDGIKMWETYK